MIEGRYRVDGLLGEGGWRTSSEPSTNASDGRWPSRSCGRRPPSSHGCANGSSKRRGIEARLVHPHIVAVLDYGEEDSSSYLVMERLPARRLRDEIIRGPLSQQRLMIVVSETLSALAAAHRRGVLHRDIKPSNILLQDDGHTKITDFGIAKSFDARGPMHGMRDDMTMTGVVLGTPGYLAPERRSGRPATVQSDIYSVGAVMLEAATGHPMTTDGAGPGVLVAPFRSVAFRALAADPDDRFRRPTTCSRRCEPSGATPGERRTAENGAQSPRRPWRPRRGLFLRPLRIPLRQQRERAPRSCRPGTRLRRARCPPGAASG